MSNIYVVSGDIAGLSETGAEISDRDALGSGIVSHVTANSISVAFDDSHDNLTLDERTPYKLVKLANDVTYRRIKRLVMASHKCT